MIPGLAEGGLAVAGLLGGLFGNKQKQTSTPTMDPAFGSLQALILKMMGQRLQSGGPDLNGYQANGIADINKTFDLAGQHSANDLTARGLGTSPIAGVVDGNLNTGRAGEISRFNNSLPLMRDQMSMQNLMAGMNFLPQGRGTTTTGTSGGGFGSGLGSMAEILAYMYGNRRQGAGA